MLKCDNGSEVSRYTLQQEADLLSELRHPHVVNMYRVLQLGWPSRESIALGLEYCERGDVLGMQLSTGALEACFEQILSALLYLHGQGARTISLSIATSF